MSLNEVLSIKARFCQIHLFLIPITIVESVDNVLKLMLPMNPHYGHPLPSECFPANHALFFLQLDHFSLYYFSSKVMYFNQQQKSIQSVIYLVLHPVC